MTDDCPVGIRFYGIMDAEIFRVGAFQGFNAFIDDAAAVYINGRSILPGYGRNGDSIYFQQSLPDPEVGFDNSACERRVCIGSLHD